MVLDLLRTLSSTVYVKGKKDCCSWSRRSCYSNSGSACIRRSKRSNISSILKINSIERAEGTKAKLAEKCPECKVTVEHLEDKEDLEEAINKADIVINATIMGMKPHQDVTLVDKSLFRKDLVVADTVYSPEKTKMILEAEEAGCKAIGGVGMLQQQGAVNYGLFVGKEMPLAEYQEFQKAQAK